MICEPPVPGGTVVYRGLVIKILKIFTYTRLTQHYSDPAGHRQPWRVGIGSGLSFSTSHPSTCSPEETLSPRNPSPSLYSLLMAFGRRSRHGYGETEQNGNEKNTPAVVFATRAWSWQEIWGSKPYIKLPMSNSWNVKKHGQEYWIIL